MTFDNFPWMLGGDVQHSEHIARAMSYVALRGAEGVVGVNDLKITPSGGMNLACAVGAFAVNNKATDGSYEAYTGRHLTGDTVEIAAAGASVRYDMVILRIEDPYYPGSPWTNPDPAGNNPAARQAHQFIRLRVLSNVPGSARTLADAGVGSQSAIPLALVTVPGSASSIIASTILDLRKTLGSGAGSETGLPVGAISAWPTETPPAGWLLCDGNYIDQGTYPTLTALLGSRFGPPLANTRKLPDFRRRTITGSGTGYPPGSDDTIGHEPSRNPYSHTHPVAGHNHAIGVSVALSEEFSVNPNTQGGGSGDRLTAPKRHSHAASGSSSAVGDFNSGAGHPAFAAINWIIKAV